MKLRVLSILVIASAVIVMAFDFCQHRQQETQIQPSVPDTQTSVSSNETIYSGLGLTEEQIEVLKTQGIAHVASAEVAYKIAGFKVGTPEYIPHGFNAGKFIVHLSGAGLLEQLKPNFNKTLVSQYYTWDGEKYPMFVIMQGLFKFGIGGSLPTEICGHPAARAFTKANPQAGVLYDKLELGWENEGICYVITSVLGKNFDEATLMKIACSTRIN
jgi:hypothetical protein